MFLQRCLAFFEVLFYFLCLTLTHNTYFGYMLNQFYISIGKSKNVVNPSQNA
jgi:hypothetical protein